MGEATDHASRMDEPGALLYLSDHEARTIEAFAERVIPEDDTGPGARAAGVVYYIDRTLAGFGSSLQDLYRRGVRQLEAYCRKRHGATFLELELSTQEAVVSLLLGSPDGPRAAEALQDEAYDLLPRLAAAIREHTIEGFFCDPAYGGNRGAVGWRLVGFPGAQWGYTAEQMQPAFDARDIPVTTLEGLRRQVRQGHTSETVARSLGDGAARSDPRLGAFPDGK